MLLCAQDIYVYNDDDEKKAHFVSQAAAAAACHGLVLSLLFVFNFIGNSLCVGGTITNNVNEKDRTFPFSYKLLHVISSNIEREKTHVDSMIVNMNFKN